MGKDIVDYAGNVIFIIAMLSLLSGVAFAATLDANNWDLGNTGGGTLDNVNTQRGQNYTALANGSIDAVKIRHSKVGAGCNFSVSISGGAPFPNATNYLIEYVDGTILAAAFANHTINFSGAYNQVAGTTYWIVFSGVDCDAVNKASIQLDKNQGYAGHTHAKNAGGWAALARDANFEVYLAGGAPPAGGCPSPTITPLSPADGLHTNTASNFYNYTLTYYDCNHLTNTSFVANGTEKLYNATPLVNGTNNFTWTFDNGDGPYGWLVRASNSTNDFNGTERDIIYDTQAPIVTAATPTANESFLHFANNYLAGVCNDTYAFNFTAEIYAPNGTLLNTYVNDTGAAPIFTLTNEFASALGVENNYYVNFTCVDSHTGSVDYGSIDKSNKSALELKHNGITKAVAHNTESALTSVDVDVLHDRQKITYKFNKPLTKFVEVLKSDKCRFYLPHSGIPGHVVFCDRWYDAAGAVKQGWNVSVKLVKGDAVITYTHAKGLSSVDPATGGLNMGFLARNFSIIPNSQLSTTTTSFYVGEEGFIVANYDNVTDGAHIAGATCNYNITDPVGTLTSATMAEVAPQYRGNFTPTFSGSHSFSVICSAAGFTGQRRAGAFNVMAAAPDLEISLVIESGDEETYAFCSGNNRVVQKNKTACIENECSVTSVSYSVACEHGCYRGICQDAPENYTIFLIIAAVIVLLILLAIGLR